MLVVDATGKPLYIIPVRGGVGWARELKYLLEYYCLHHPKEQQEKQTREIAEECYNTFKRIYESGEKGDCFVLDSKPQEISGDTSIPPSPEVKENQETRRKKKHHIKDSSKPDEKILDQAQDRKRI